MSTSNICVDELRVNPEIKTSLARTVRSNLQRIGCTLKEWNRRKIERRQLLFLSDSLLKDIGISRADADIEARKPFWKE